MKSDPFHSSHETIYQHITHEYASCKRHSWIKIRLSIANPKEDTQNVFELEKKQIEIFVC